MSAILDPNVIISALIAPGGSPAKVLRAWLEGRYELVVSSMLRAELARALRYPKLRSRITPIEAATVLELLTRQAQMHADPEGPSGVRSPDPGDDYLIALAAAARAVIVSGDGHLLGLSEVLPIYSPAAFLADLGAD